MTHTHAVASGTEPTAGQCAWAWEWEDVTLRCTSPAIPGGDECADHLIERVHADVRQFGPVAVTVNVYNEAL